MRLLQGLLTSCLAIILSSSAVAAESEPVSVQLQWLDPSGSVAALDWPVTTRMLWGRTKTDMGEFATPEFQVSITPPPGLALESTPGQMLVLRTTNPVDMLRLAVKKADGSREDVGLRIEFVPQDPVLLVHESCARTGIKLIARGGNAKFLFLAVSCRLESDRYIARVFASDDVIMAVNDEYSGFVQNSSQELLMEFRRAERVHGIEVLGSLRVNKKISDEVMTVDIIREPMFGPEPEPLVEQDARKASFFSGLQKHGALGAGVVGALSPAKNAMALELFAKARFEVPKRKLTAETDASVAVVHGISTLDAVVGRKVPGVSDAYSFFIGAQLAGLALGSGAPANGVYGFPELGLRADFDTAGDGPRMNDVQLAVLPSFTAPPSLELHIDADTGWHVGKSRVGVAGKFQLYNVGHTNVTAFGLGFVGWF